MWGKPQAREVSFHSSAKAKLQPKDSLPRLVLIAEQTTESQDYGFPRPLPSARWNAPKSTTVMILPQVHLRKPCYDFYFL